MQKKRWTLKIISPIIKQSARAGTKMAAKKELLLRAPLQEKAQKKSHRKEFIQRDYREMKRERTRTKKESTKVRFQKKEQQRKESTKIDFKKKVSKAETE